MISTISPIPFKKIITASLPIISIVYKTISLTQRSLSCVTIWVDEFAPTLQMRNGNSQKGRLLSWIRLLLQFYPGDQWVVVGHWELHGFTRDSGAHSMEHSNALPLEAHSDWKMPRREKLSTNTVLGHKVPAPSFPQALPVSDPQFLCHLNPAPRRHRIFIQQSVLSPTPFLSINSTKVQICSNRLYISKSAPTQYHDMVKKQPFMTHHQAILSHTCFMFNDIQE